jgi:hypothetical protein
VDDSSIENHPDLMDPDWQRHAEKEAWTELRAKRRRAKRGKRLAWTAVLLAAVLASAVGVYRWGTATAHDQGAALPVSGAPSTSAAPSTIPEFAKVDLSRPFDNTPAQYWADGPDGLTTPAAVKIGTFSVAEVQDAYDRVKKLIAAAELDRRMLERHDTSGYLVLLAPSEQDRLRPILANRSTNEFGSYITMLADGFHLLQAGPKINGRLSARLGDRPAELVVHAEYIVGYAFDPGAYRPITSPTDIDTFQRTAADFVIRTSPPYVKRDAGLSLGAGEGWTYSMACGPAKAGYLAPTYSERSLHTPEGGDDQTKVFDLNAPMPTSGTC